MSWTKPTIISKSLLTSISHCKKKNPKSKTTFIEIFTIINFSPLFLCYCKGVEITEISEFNARGIEITNFRSPQLTEGQGKGTADHLMPFGDWLMISFNGFLGSS